MKKVRKLVLSKETLLKLDPKNLEEKVWGGRPADKTEYETDCTQYPGGIPSIHPCSDYTEYCTEYC